MSFITKNTDLRSLSYATFAKPEDGAVFKKIPGLNEDRSTSGLEKQVTARVDDTLRMSRLLVGDFRKKDDLVITDPQTDVILDVVERKRGTNSRTQAGNKFLANLALINQQATLAKIQKRDFTGLGSTVFDGAKDVAKTIASTLAQVPVAGTGTHFVNGGKVGKEYLKGGGNAVGNFLRGLAGGEPGLQGHENVLSGQPIVINRQKIDDLPTSLRSRLEATSPDNIVQQPASTLVDRLIERLTPSGRATVSTRIRWQGEQNRKNRRLLTSIDQINSSDVLQEIQTTGLGYFYNKDIIPFEFQIFDPAAGGQPDYVYFRAYLDTFGDDYAGSWNATKYIGRAENLYNYQGFDRTINFSFKLAAHTREELTPLYKKLNYLVGTTAPSYNENQTFMRGIFCKLTIGDYLAYVPGFFDSISISWDKNYPWELGLENDNSKVPIVPHMLNISMNYKPVHNFNPELGKSFITTDQFNSKEFVLRRPNNLSTDVVKPVNYVAGPAPEIDLSQAGVSVPKLNPVSPQELPKVTLSSLNNVPQRPLTTVQIGGQ